MNEKIRLLENRLLMIDGEEAIVVHNQLSNAYMYRNKEKVFHHSNKAIQLCKRHPLPNEEAIAYFNLGNYFLMKDDFEVCVEYFKQALLVCSFEAIDLRAKIFIKVATFYALLHDFDKGIHYIDKAIQLVKDTNYHSILCRAYITMGRVHRYLEEFDIADFYYKEASRLSELYELNEMIPETTLVSVHNHLHTFDLEVEKDLLYIESYIEKEGDLWFLGPIKIQWAAYYILSDTLDAAVMNYEMGLDILEEDMQHSCLVSAYSILTFALTYKGHDDMTLNLLKRAERYFESNDYTLGLPKLYLSLSKYYSRVGQAAMYQQYLRKYVKIKTELEQFINQFF